MKTVNINLGSPKDTETDYSHRYNDGKDDSNNDS